MQSKAAHILHRLSEIGDDSPHAKATQEYNQAATAPAGTQQPASKLKVAAGHAGRFAARTARLSYHKYLPKEHQRAGKIARYGGIGLIAAAPIVKKVSATAGTMAGMAPDDRSKLIQSVHQTVKDPESRGALIQGAKSYMKDPETLQALGRNLRKKAINAAAPFMRLKELIPGKKPAGPEPVHPGVKVWKNIGDTSNPTLPIHRIARAAENDPIMQTVGHFGAEGVKHALKHPSSILPSGNTTTGSASSGSGGILQHLPSWSDITTHASKAASLLHKVHELPVFKKG